MKFELDEYNRGITDEELMADLKNLRQNWKKSLLSRFSILIFPVKDQPNHNHPFQ